MPRPIRLMTVAPGHFHAALVQKQMVPGVHPRAYVYAPLDADLLAHLGRIAAFNRRTIKPTAWELDIRTSDEFLDRMLREQPGNTVVLAGRNKPKIGYLLAALRNGLHVLADKPWVIDPDDFPKLEEVFREADVHDVIARDVMTERFEVPTQLQRELVRDPDVFGTIEAGTPNLPGLSLESVHYLKKTVAGQLLRRPGWWFDESQAGHALADVGTHLADLAMWLLFPDQSIDYRRDVRVLEAAAWPTPLDREQVEAIVRPEDIPAFPPDGRLLYQGNGTATVLLGGVHVRLTTLWDYESADGSGDTHEAIARGTVATISVRHEAGRPELTATAMDPADHERLIGAITLKCESWQAEYPRVQAEDRGADVRLVIPEAVRTTHEEHFTQVVQEFVSHFQNPRQVPDWERPNLLAKYYMTTQAVKLARRRAAG